MLHTKEQYKEALEQAAISAETWHKKAKTSCKSSFTCPNTGFQWPAIAFCLSLGYKDLSKMQLIKKDLFPNQNKKKVHGFTTTLQRIYKESDQYTVHDHYLKDVERQKGTKAAKAFREFANKL